MATGCSTIGSCAMCSVRKRGGSTEDLILSDKVRFGLIGYGAWGGHHARAICENSRAELRAIAVKSEASRERAHAERPGARVYGDYREMLAKEELDVVAVVLP